MEAPVVVGVDGSDGSLRALDWAVDEAVRHGRALRIVHASPWERYEGAAPDASTERPAGRVEAEKLVGGAEDRARRRAPGLAVKGEVTSEEATGALLREGQEAMLVVVGSRGRSELGDLLLGSVGLVVAARAHGPVVVVRGDASGLESHHARVVLGVGDHDLDSPAVRFAFREAAVRDAALDVVRAWRRPAHDPVDHPLIRGETGLVLEQRASKALDEALEAAASEYPQVRIHRNTVEGTARRVLTERSATADLLVVGARRSGRLLGLELGRVAHRALHHASCPVAVVPMHRTTAHGERAPM
ncbi:universal stress protein [Streptomyces sp. KLOTTS4A1]|uniref:universal stress protein n=1 Tax=Streptomyces sp. KLOTTS4A1 TaxID=3390996 RepID=UPI0039F4589B